MNAVIDSHEVTVFVAGPTPYELDPVDSAGTITADRGWSPHIQGRITVRTPAAPSVTLPGEELIIELVQRFGTFAITRDLTIRWAGQTTADLTAEYGGGTTADLTALITAGSWNTPARTATTRTLKLVIVSRSVTRDTHTLEVASHEALIQDWKWYKVDANLEGVPLTFTANTVSEYLNALIDGHATVHFNVPGFFDTKLPIVDRSTPATITPTSYTIEAGEGTFASLEPLLTEKRKRLYSPGDGTLTLTDYPYDAAGSITVEAGVNLIDWEVTDQRYTETIVRFSGTDADPEARPIYFSATLPAQEFPPETLIEAPHHPTLGPSQGGGILLPEVAPYLDRVGLDESPVRLVTVNDYSIMPGSEVSYTLPDETPVTDHIDSLTWTIGGTWQMDLWI